MLCTYHISPCGAMLCYATLCCCSMRCYAFLSDHTSCYVVLYYVLSCYIMSWFGMLCYPIMYHSILYHMNMIVIIIIINLESLRYPFRDRAFESERRGEDRRGPSAYIYIYIYIYTYVCICMYKDAHAG